MFRFPWTNEHEINLDWILKQIKRLTDLVNEKLRDYPVASNALPKDLGPRSPGTSVEYSRADHVHQMPTIAIPIPSSSTPQPLGTASAGSSNQFSRGDHVHQMPDLSSYASSASVNTLSDQALRGKLSGNITSNNYMDFWTDANDQPDNTVYYYHSSLTDQMVSNLPSYGAAIWLACIDSTTTSYGQVQIAITAGVTSSARRMWFRDQMIANTWRPWMKVCTEYTLGSVVAKYQESSMTASRNYSAGALIFIDGFLYKTTTSILNGETLIQGTNVDRTTIADELSAINP